MIPKIIHQIWLGEKDQMPTEIMKTVRDKHTDWKYFLWTEKSINNIYNQKNYDAVQNNKYPTDNKYTTLSDIIRYEKLYEYGGIYIDADSICNKPFDDLLDNQLFVAYENEIKRPNLIANGIIGSVPNHTVIKMCVDKIHLLKTRKILNKPSFITTGPQLLTNCINQYGISNIKILPSWYFFPVHYTGYVINQNINPLKDSYTNQLWHSTKRKKVSIIKRLLNKIKNNVS